MQQCAGCIQRSLPLLDMSDLRATLANTTGKAEEKMLHSSYISLHGATA